MPEIILSERQLEYLSKKVKDENQLKSIQEKWDKCTKEEKKFILEFLYQVNKSQNSKPFVIQEGWWNNVLGLIGWVDPTGLADAVNGVLYMRQGDYLFGFLSLVSAVPYAGDIVAKPVMAALKVGSPSAKALNNVMKLSKAGKSTEAANELARISSTGGLVGKFTKGVGKIADKLEELVKNIPSKALQGFKDTILQWIRLFKGAAKTGAATRTSLQGLAKTLPTLSKAEQLTKLKEMKKILDSTKGPFRAYRTSGPLFSWKSFWRGMPQAIGRNASVRALMRKTKWYLGLLDFMGIGNFVGPDELINQMGEAKFNERAEAYNQTAEAQQNLQDDFGSDGISEPTTAPAGGSSQQSNQGSSLAGSDPLSFLLALK